MSDDDGYWRFCAIVEREIITTPTVTAPPHTERAVLEQHTDSGAYRLRPLDAVTDGAERIT